MNERVTALTKIATAMSDAQQDELLAYALELMNDRGGIYQLSDDERAAVERGLEEMRAGHFATDAEVAAVFNRHR